MRRRLLALALLPSFASATVAYTLKPDPVTRTFEVTVTVPQPQPTETFTIPGWSPGFYFMQKYADKVRDVQATANGVTVPVDHGSLRTWTVKGATGPLTLHYRIVADDPGLGFFGTSVKTDTAFENGPADLMSVVGRTTEPTTMAVTVPTGWDVASAMPKDDQGRFTADGYDELADMPIQMGNFTRRTFKVGDIPFEAIFVLPKGERMAADPDAQAEILRKVSIPAPKLFGGTSFKRYLYIFHLAPGGFQGGLEHRASTVIAIPNDSDLHLPDLAGHEYFHAWNVKQIRPKPLGPFDYTQPARTGNLWFAEGVTDYYAKLLAYRGGTESLSWMIEQFNLQVQQYEDGTTRKTKTVEDASRAAWENGGFNLGDLDYYNKGLLAGLIFDAAIRTETKGARSLDDVMRLLYRKYRLPNPGYDEDGILAAINEVAGKDMTPLYRKVVRSTEELPYDVLEGIGLRVTPPGGELLQTSTSLGGGDEFLGYAPPTVVGQANVRVRRAGMETTIHLPTERSRARIVRLEIDPEPTAEASLRFREWIAR